MNSIELSYISVLFTSKAFRHQIHFEFTMVKDCSLIIICYIHTCTFADFYVFTETSSLYHVALIAEFERLVADYIYRKWVIVFNCQWTLEFFTTTRSFAPFADSRLCWELDTRSTFGCWINPSWIDSHLTVTKFEALLRWLTILK